MWRRGARVVGVDVSTEQLATARRLAAEHGAEVAFLLADVEAVPLRSGSFDFAVSEYGAALWCDPERWLGEAHRLLRPGGRLHFLTATAWTTVCSDEEGRVGRVLRRPYFGVGRSDWSTLAVDPGGIEFTPTLGDWFALFGRIGFAVEGYRGLAAPATASGRPFAVDADWARRWPSEQVFELVRSERGRDR